MRAPSAVGGRRRRPAAAGVRPPTRAAMPAWGRLEDPEDGRVHKLEKPVVSVGRRPAQQADILVEAVANRAGDYFCSAVQFELRHRDGRSVVIDKSTNGTFLNLDDAAAEKAFRSQRDEKAWLAQQNPDPKLKKGREEQIFDGDCLFLRPDHSLDKFKKFVFRDGPGEDSDTSDGEGEASDRVVPSSLNDDAGLAHATNEEEDDEENWAPLPGLFCGGKKSVAPAEAPVAPWSTGKCVQSTPSPHRALASARRGMGSSEASPADEAQTSPASTSNTAGHHPAAAKASSSGKASNKRDKARATGNYQPLTIIASNPAARSAQEPAEAVSTSRKRAHEAESPCSTHVRQEREHAAAHTEAQRLSKIARQTGDAGGGTASEPRAGGRALRNGGREGAIGAGSGEGGGG